MAIYTWRNNREGRPHIRKRLDRAVANEQWICNVPKSALLHLDSVNLDHSPIFLNLWSEMQTKPIPFRFESVWSTDPTRENTILEAWSPRVIGSKAFKFSTKVRNTKKALK